MERNIIQTQVCGADDLSEEIRQKLAAAPDHTCFEKDCIYLLLDRTVCRLPNDPAGKALAYAVIRRRNGSPVKPGSAAEMYQKILEEDHFRPESSALKQYGIRPDSRCSALVFRACIPLEKDLYSVVSSMAPMEAADVLVPVDYRTVLFVKDPAGQSAEEIREFTEALIGTMEAEGIVDIRAGIGGAYAGADGIRKGFAEAMQALETGMRFHPRDHVSVYAEQTLERIVEAIPEDKKASLREAFFGNGPSAGLSEEMIETVRVFFRNDLNLTAASKQLFIHRNTLNYRLDKIKKDYGLDLRSFRDAVVFRIMSEISSDQSSETRT
ncbi:MAG: helix-turn-helix domain-containing protein [Eubacteriales bacterium]